MSPRFTFPRMYPLLTYTYTLSHTQRSSHGERERETRHTLKPSTTTSSVFLLTSPPPFLLSTTCVYTHMSPVFFFLLLLHLLPQTLIYIHTHTFTVSKSLSASLSLFPPTSVLSFATSLRTSFILLPAFPLNLGLGFVARSSGMAGHCE